ncbi:MAG: hypothetical protein M3394_05210 [Actinomycetota bacterium]|nr:hypothetical protein [Actinomycetota bacterium]
MPQAAAPDWTVQAADTVEKVVGAVRDKTTVPLTTIARALVYGLLAAFLGVATLVLLAIAAVRAIVVVTPGERAWVAHAAVGGIFTLAGLFLLRKATAGKKG